MADETARGATDVAGAKRALRAEVLARRRALSAAELGAAAAGIRDVALGLAVLQRAATVALYASTGTEPGTRPLIAALRERGARVLLPVLRPDLDLDWAPYTGALMPGERGTVQPAGDPLGLDAIASADAVLVPALAVGPEGERLGRGGGSYDRALARTRPGAVVTAVVYDSEVLAALPTETHDIRVARAITPRERHDFGTIPC